MTMQLRKAFISVPAPAPAHMELRGGRAAGVVSARALHRGTPAARGQRGRAARTHYCGVDV
jgi:hypothetical protein